MKKLLMAMAILAVGTTAFGRPNSRCTCKSKGRIS